MGGKKAAAAAGAIASWRRDLMDRRDLRDPEIDRFDDLAMTGDR